MGSITSHKRRNPERLDHELTSNNASLTSCAAVKILVLASLYPPHHTATYDVRCQTFVETMRTRGHTLHVLTSTHGIGHEQRGSDVERRFLLNGAFGHPLVADYKELKALEVQNHAVLQET